MSADLPDPTVVEIEAQVRAWAAQDVPLQALLATGVSPVNALLRRGSQFVRDNCLPEAVARLRAATILAPTHAEAWTNLGVALDRANELPLAAAALERSLALAGQQPDTWLLLGLTRGKQGEFAAAEAAYRRALALDPKSALVWQCLGLLKEGQKLYPEAIDCFAACIQRGGGTAALWANVGKLLHQTGRIPEASRAYEEAVALDPGNAYFREMLRKVAFLRAVLESPSIDAAIAAYRHTAPPAAEAKNHGLENLFHAAFGFLSGFGFREAAIRLGEKHLELWPESQSMTYLLQAVRGTSNLARSPAAYITEHFDAFAAGFDSQLVGTLGYDIPEKLCGALRSFCVPGTVYDIVDAGCGTGLCGPFLQPIARSLVGVDLSPKMLEQAAKRGLYSELVCEDLTGFLLRAQGRFDVFVAADVVIYFGDLVPLFTATALAVRPGGLLAVSTERLATGTYQVLPSGRFAHTSEYVQTAAGTAWVPLATAETTVRLEATARVPGQLFIFRRQSK